jgi:hypothetical protein
LHKSAGCGDNTHIAHKPSAEPREGTVADKSSQLVLTALSRAVTDPTGVPLVAARSAPGLFPGTAAGKQAAQRCRDEGLIQPVDSRPEVWTITDQGLSYLLDQVSPRQVLEDFVRALEARQTQAAELLDTARRMYQTLDALKARVEQVLPQVPHVRLPDHNGDNRSLTDLFAAFRNGAPQQGADAPRAPESAVDAALTAHLERWQTSGASEDFPLPDLFRRTVADVPGLTLGAFHDALRRLHDTERLYLHPWTGPLYDLPEPPFALLVGHNVAYYASIRRAV